MGNGAVAAAAAAAIANAIKASSSATRGRVFTQSPEPIQLPADVETIRAAKIWVPD